MFSKASVILFIGEGMHRCSLCVAREGMHSRGHAWQGGMQGKGSIGGSVEEGVHGRRDGYCSGRYASYWNAFLFR